MDYGVVVAEFEIGNGANRIQKKGGNQQAYGKHRADVGGASNAVATSGGMKEMGADGEGIWTTLRRR